MRRIKRLIRDWLGFSSTEINGFLILLPLMFLIIFSEPIFRMLYDHPNTTPDHARLDSLIALWPQEEKDSSMAMTDTKIDGTDMKAAKPLKDNTLFRFDPNTCSEKDLQRLGFPQFLSTRIAVYRQKGGKFRVKSDLMKIYGMDSALYHRLYAYISIPEVLKSQPSEITNPSGYKNSTRFDLNEADSSQLKSVRGIGSKLALRIIRFRDALGGFVQGNQLHEVYGLDSAVTRTLLERAFIDEKFKPKKLNVNKADEKILSSHPYMKRNLSKAIVTYRFQHGDFKSLDELYEIKSIDPEALRKAMPYLTITD